MNAERSFADDFVESELINVEIDILTQNGEFIEAQQVINRLMTNFGFYRYNAYTLEDEKTHIIVRTLHYQGNLTKELFEKGNI